MSVLFLSLGTTRARAVRNYTAFLLARGVDVDIVTVNPEPWREVGLDARARLLTLREGEGRHPLPRTERVLVFRLPRAGFAALHLVRLLPGIGRPADRLVAAAERVQLRCSQAFHDKVFVRFYRLLRPWVLWRISRRQVLRGIDWPATEQVVICDSHAIPIGWHLARRHAELAVAFELDRTRYLDLPALDDAVDAVQGNPADEFADEFADELAAPERPAATGDAEPAPAPVPLTAGGLPAAADGPSHGVRVHDPLAGR